MNLLGLELCDAGILVAGGEPPRLLRIDEDSLESPGFALPEKKALATGIAAERRARLFPRQIMNRFWDSLSTDPLNPPLPAAGNQAEVACAHLAQIWNQARRFGNALVIAVPAGFQRTQLGLILGMSQELGIPVQGFISLPVAAADPVPAPREGAPTTALKLLSPFWSLSSRKASPSRFTPRRTQAWPAGPLRSRSVEPSGSALILPRHWPAASRSRIFSTSMTRSWDISRLVRRSASSCHSFLSLANTDSRSLGWV